MAKRKNTKSTKYPKEPAKTKSAFFKEIEREFRKGLTGNFEDDIRLLTKKVEYFEGHLFFDEIAETGMNLLRERYGDLVPEPPVCIQDDEASKLHEKLEQIADDLERERFDAVLTRAGKMVKQIEKLGKYRETDECRYFSFTEPFEQILSNHLYPTRKKTILFDAPYPAVYLVYAQALFSLGRPDEARAAAEKGLYWNPVDFDLAALIAEIEKDAGKMESFYAKSKELFKIAFQPECVAFCYKNLSEYFQSQNLEFEPMICAVLAKPFTDGFEDDPFKFSFFETKKGKSAKSRKVPGLPSKKQMKTIIEKAGIPSGADEEIVALAAEMGQQAILAQDPETAAYAFRIAFLLTQDETFAAILDELDPYLEEPEPEPVDPEDLPF